ncbi:hypothetical protein BDW69DRAFT_161983 [Aspergillus filifer]
MGCTSLLYSKSLHVVNIAVKFKKSCLIRSLLLKLLPASSCSASTLRLKSKCDRA